MYMGIVLWLVSGLNSCVFSGRRRISRSYFGDGTCWDDFSVSASKISPTPSNKGAVCSVPVTPKKNQ